MHWVKGHATNPFNRTRFLKEKYHPEDENFILEFEENVQHHEFIASLQKPNVQP
jgi:hypothetical protein